MGCILYAIIIIIIFVVIGKRNSRLVAIRLIGGKKVHYFLRYEHKSYGYVWALVSVYVFE